MITCLALFVELHTNKIRKLSTLQFCESNCSLISINLTICSNAQDHCVHDFSVLQLHRRHFRRCQFRCRPFRHRTILLPKNFGTGTTRFSIKFSSFFIYIILLLCLKNLFSIFILFLCQCITFS